MIKNYLKEIKTTNLNQQTNFYNHQRWEKSLSNKKALDALIAFKNFNKKALTRTIVIEEFKKYFKNPKKHNVLRPFLLSMIWGYEGTGYGPQRTEKYFLDKDLGNKIKMALENINDKTIKDAYMALVSIKYLGTSFASKVLYFAAKAKGLKKYPLIFDIRAATGLVILSTSKSMIEMVSVSPKKGWDAYYKYYTEVHDWSKKYKIKADKIETYLFNLAKLVSLENS